MPNIIRFYGMIIKMSEGDLPAKAQALVREWAVNYKEDLLKIWNTQEFIHLPPLE